MTDFPRKSKFLDLESRRTGKSKAEIEATRPFVMWDGEGVSHEDYSNQIYVLLANSLGDKLCYLEKDDGVSIENHGGLTTWDCFKFMLEFARDNPLAINVGYAFGYDVNMILRDLPIERIKEIKITGRTRFNLCRVQWIPSKLFKLTSLVDWPDQGVKKGTQFLLYDVIGFFQTSFLNTCREYLGDETLGQDMMEVFKAARNEFTWDQIEDIIKYNDYELANGVEIMNRLRDRIHRVHITMPDWIGPGTIAKQLMYRNSVKSHMDQTIRDKNDPLGIAIRTAYAGGRFEMIKFGRTNKRTYSYDINSAYPEGLTKVPSLAGGKWTHIDGDPGDKPFAIYHVVSKGLTHWYPTVLPEGWPGKAVPAPLWHRAKDGTIAYPHGPLEGWYWSPEIEMLREYYPHFIKTIQEHFIDVPYKITEAWVFEPANDTKPFAFIDALYRQRQVMKERGDNAQVALKLGLNSLYGKTIQQVGFYTRKDGTITVPPFHQMEWGGFVTSYCRAKVMKAVLNHLTHVISFETDGIFTTQPLDVPVSNALGDWEKTIYQNMFYLQSGFYFAEGKRHKAKYRGIPEHTISEDAINEVYDWLESVYHRWDDPSHVRIPYERVQFIGMKQALIRGMELWCTWRNELYFAKIYPEAYTSYAKSLGYEPWEMEKRVHDHEKCKAHDIIKGKMENNRWISNKFHTTEVPIDNFPQEPNPPYTVHWIDGLDRLREIGEQLSLFDEEDEKSLYITLAEDISWDD